MTFKFCNDVLVLENIFSFLNTLSNFLFLCRYKWINMSGEQKLFIKDNTLKLMAQVTQTHTLTKYPYSYTQNSVQ